MTKPEEIRRHRNLEQAALAAYLAANPSMTARDFKGKGFGPFAPFDKHHVGPGEKPWHKLDREQVRKAATSEKARFLSKGERQAAGRDPGLVWDEQAGAYRRRADAPPHPSLPSPGGAQGEGAANVTGPA